MALIKGKMLSFFVRGFSTKPDLKALATKTINMAEATPNHLNFRYNVCREKTPTFRKLELNSQKLSMQELQPSMQTPFYTSPAEISYSRANEQTKYKSMNVMKIAPANVKTSRVAKQFQDPPKNLATDEDKEMMMKKEKNR